MPVHEGGAAARRNGSPWELVGPGPGTRPDDQVWIRAAEPSELEVVHQLDQEVFEDLAYPPFVLRQLFELHREFWLIADHPDGPRGYSFGVPASNPRLAWLLGLGVVPRFRGHGYGRLLATASLRLLTSVGVREVRLTVEPGNDSAIALYHDLGFNSRTMCRDYFGPGEDRLLMTTHLPVRPAPQT
jgi:ribosomal-protein-alanine N-acetyltransferase